MINPIIIKFDTLASTNDLLKEHYESFPDFTVIQTGYQTKGRGQFDHVWASNKDENLLFSILLKSNFTCIIDQIKHITLDVLFKFFQSYDIKVRFKEPNDIFVGNDKICGILIETRYEKNDLSYIVIGIGVNINQETFTGFPAISMKTLKEKTFDINLVFDKIIKLFQKQLNQVINQ